MALRQHLRADEDVDVAGVHAVAHRRERALAARAVAIDARDARAGKALDERALEPLRAVAERQQVDVAALGTRARQPLRVAAVMAAQCPGVAMDDEPRAAARAARLPAARRAEQRRREAAAVDEHERLLAASEPGLDRREERTRRSLRPSPASRFGANTTVGRRAGANARTGSLSQRYRPRCACTSVSSAGVALPSTTGTARRRARHTATSRP